MSEPQRAPPHDEIEALRRTVAEHAERERRALGLGDGPLDVAWIVNWGGFGANASFRVSDGRTAVRLKLAAADEDLDAVRRWRDVAPLLEERYLAPRMTGWTRVEAAGREGPVFAWAPGASPPCADAALVATLAPVLARLHADRELAGRIGVPGRAPTCRDAYLAVYEARLRWDLRALRVERPPFLDDATLAWMEAETGRLRAAVDAAAAFDLPAALPAHTDLWMENVLRDDAGRVTILDWDGPSLGDPAMDWAMLLGPSCGRIAAADAGLLPAALAADRAFRERFDLYARAALLDWTIDPLTDWVACRVTGERTPEFQAAFAATSRAAHAAYRALGA